MTELYLDTGKDVLNNQEKQSHRVKELFGQDVELLYRPNEELLIQIEGTVAEDTEYFYLREEISQATNYQNFSQLLESHTRNIAWNIEKGSSFNRARLGEVELGREADTKNVDDPSLGTDYVLVASIEEGIQTFNKLRRWNLSILIANEGPVSLSSKDVDFQIIVRPRAEETPRSFEPSHLPSAPDPTDSSGETASTGRFEYNSEESKEPGQSSETRRQSSQDEGEDRTPSTAGASNTGQEAGNDSSDTSTAITSETGSTSGPDDDTEGKDNILDVGSHQSDNGTETQESGPEPDPDDNRSEHESEVPSPGESDSKGESEASQRETEESTAGHEAAESEQSMNAEPGDSTDRPLEAEDDKESADTERAQSKANTESKSTTTAADTEAGQSSGDSSTEKSSGRTAPLIPSDARLEVFDGPTGEKYFDSDGDVSGTDETIRKMYHDGVSLHYDPGTNTVICYFNARQNSPQQFIARYTASGKTGDDLLRGFKEAVQEWLIEDAGWSFVENAGVKQVVFDSLVDAEPLDPDYSESEFEKMSETSPVHFVAPNVYNALRLFQYFRDRTRDNASIAISSSGVTSELESTEYIIQPGFTEEDAEPIEGSATKHRLAEHRLYEHLETGQQKLQQMAKNLPESIPSTHRQGTLAEAINAEALEGEEIVVTDSNVKWRLRAESDIVMIAVAVVVMTLGVAYFTFSGAIDGAISELGSQAEVGLPGASQLPSVLADITISAQASTFVGGMVGLTILGIVALGIWTILSKGLLRYFQLGLPFSSSKTNGVAEEGNSLGETLIDIQEDYESAKHLHDSSKTYHEIVEETIFEPISGVNLDLKKEADIGSDRTGYLAIGAIMGITVGLGLIFVVYAFLWSISAYTSTVAQVSAYVLGIYLILTVGGAAYFGWSMLGSSDKQDKNKKSERSSR